MSAKTKRGYNDEAFQDRNALMGQNESMLQKKMQNIECVLSYELYVMDGGMVALQAAVHYNYREKCLQPLEALIERYNKESKTIEKLNAPKNVLCKYPMQGSD